MKLPTLEINGLKTEFPIFLGGMGIGITRSKVASAVANEGGVGIMSGVQIGYDEPDFDQNPFEANLRALAHHIRSAREKSPTGVLGINFMTVMNRYGDYVKKAVEEGIDLIVSGAGLPLELPAYVSSKKTGIVPIVSSGRALKLILRKWDTKYTRTADAVVLEGTHAGGHLGFKNEEINEDTFSFRSVILDLKNILKQYEQKYSRKIPVVVAGGFYNRQDVESAIEWGADGVQLGTRFIGTEECDASEAYKKTFVTMKEEDIKIITSPVGLPARVYENTFIKSLIEGEKIIPDNCTRCIRDCYPGKNQFCISEALINAVKGKVDQGLIFTGSNGYRIDEIRTVKEIFKEFRD